MVKKIGLYGGSFDPIHTGHLIVSESVRELLDLDKVIFIPTFISPHKIMEPVSAKHRLGMLNLAISENPYFQVSDYEIKNKKISYTIDSILHFQRIFPNDKIYLIIGKDSLIKFDTWKDYEKIIDLTQVVVAQREVLKDDLVTDGVFLGFEKIISLKTPNIEISSTDIRSRVLEKKSIKYLVPKSVEDYIYENNIYETLQ